MQILHPRVLLGVPACLAACLSIGLRAGATGVPIDGFLPQVGISLNRDFVEDLSFFPVAKNTMAAPQLGPPWYDVALLDTGAAVSLINTPARANFNFDAEYNGVGGEEDGFGGTNPITIGGATGFVEAEISDLLGLYANGLQTRTGDGVAFTMNSGAMFGQTNSSIVVVPPESDLPNVLGFSYLGQYATRMLSDLPQIFTIAGQTVRTPAIEFAAVGSGGMGIVRRATISFQGSSPLTPQHAFNIFDPEALERPWEDPVGPTFVSGGMYVNVSVNDAVNNGGGALSVTPFFLDTGASITVLSEENAALLGFDVALDEPEFTLAVVGSGGTALDVPGFYADNFTVHATGGNLTLQNVPIVVLDIRDPGNPNNIIGGFVGTNLFYGRNLVIDPAPGNARLYISDPVTTTADWSTAAASASWATAANWSEFATPDVKTITNLRHVSGGSQVAVLSANAMAWEVNVSGTAANQTMTLSVQSGVKLTTFSGLNIEPFGIVALSGGALDVQYVDIRNGGRLIGSGSIATGSGEIPGQVENYSGTVTVGAGLGTLAVEGRYANGKHGTLEMEIGGTSPVSQYDRLTVDGDVTLAGVLTLSLVNSFVPALGNTFTLLTATGELGGVFDAMSLPLLPADRMWAVLYQPSALELKVTIPGDYNGNGAVGSADFAAWKALFGKPYSGLDFLTWQRTFAGGSSTTGVPEPGAALLAVIAAIVAVSRRRGRLAA